MDIKPLEKMACHSPGCIWERNTF